jgi:hypothetical protein
MQRSWGNGTLFALNEGIGAIVWKYEFGKIYYLNPPTYDNGAIYLQMINYNDVGLLYCFNSTTGQVKWTSLYSTQYFMFLAPMVAAGQVSKTFFCPICVRGYIWACSQLRGTRLGPHHTFSCCFLIITKDHIFENN